MPTPDYVQVKMMAVSTTETRTQFKDLFFQLKQFS